MRSTQTSTKNRNRPHEKHDPDASFDALAFITEHVWEAMERRPAGENFNGRGTITVQIIVGLGFNIHGSLCLDALWLK